jgi:hypothetical protein
MQAAPKPINAKIEYNKAESKLRALFSKFIRNRDENICFTCGKYGDENGHYISCSHKGLKFNEKNCNCQCTECNCYKRGNLEVYKQKLIEKYGEYIFLEFSNASRTKKSLAEILELIKHYEGILK